MPRAHSIREWLESIDPLLGAYEAQFFEFGYDNVGLLRQATESELLEDLHEMGAKKNHCRLILRSFSKLIAEAEVKVEASSSVPGTLSFLDEVHRFVEPLDCSGIRLVSLVRPVHRGRSCRVLLDTSGQCNLSQCGACATVKPTYIHR